MPCVSGDDSFPELLSPESPPNYTFLPHYCQYFYSDLAGREERNVGTVVQVFTPLPHPLMM